MAVGKTWIVEVKMVPALAVMELLDLENPWRVLLGFCENSPLSDL